MVTCIRSDLDFILEQIKISGARAAGQQLFGPGGLIRAAYNLSMGLVDRTYNHLLRSPMAMSLLASAIPGNGDTEYEDGLLDAHFIAGDGRFNENIGRRDRSKHCPCKGQDERGSAPDHRHR